jgi:RND superfamily putative drug exporter
VAAGIVVGAASFGLPKPANPDPVSSTGLSVQWQSTQAERLQGQLPATDVQPAFVVLSRADGRALTDADRAAVTNRSADLGRVAVGGQVAPPQVSPDGTVALAVRLTAATSRNRPSPVGY